MDWSSHDEPVLKQEASLPTNEDGAPILPASEDDDSLNNSQRMVKLGKFGNIKQLMSSLSSRDDSFLDLDLICKDGKILPCHKFIIGAQSTYLRQLMLSVEKDGGNSDGNPCKMNFPDVEVEHMEVILTFLYSG